MNELSKNSQQQKKSLLSGARDYIQSTGKSYKQRQKIEEKKNSN